MKKSNPLVSILIPLYNAEEYLSDTLESIIEQTYKNIEIIIVDDASTDNTQEIVKKFQNNDNRIRYIKNEFFSLFGPS